MSESKSNEPKSGFADFYEEFIVPTMSAQWAPKVADAASIKLGDKVLDVGCGTHIPTGSTAAAECDKQGFGSMIRHRNTP